ncbi:MAG: hypothetical protein WDM92_07545 [Caulobacteraceae bacterium]
MPDAAAPTLEEPAEGALGRLQWLPSVRLQVLAALFRRLSERRYEDLFGLSFPGPPHHRRDRRPGRGVVQAGVPGGEARQEPRQPAGQPARRPRPPGKVARPPPTSAPCCCA